MVVQELDIAIIWCSAADCVNYYLKGTVIDLKSITFSLTHMFQPWSSAYLSGKREGEYNKSYIKHVKLLIVLYHIHCHCHSVTPKKRHVTMSLHCWPRPELLMLMCNMGFISYTHQPTPPPSLLHMELHHRNVIQRPAASAVIPSPSVVPPLTMVLSLHDKPAAELSLLWYPVWMSRGMERKASISASELARNKLVKG